MTMTPCPSNPLGIKGCGEAGAIAAPPAVINAITDALGHEDIAMPATPQVVWRAAQKSSRHGRWRRNRGDGSCTLSTITARRALRQAASLARQGRGREVPRRRPHAAADDEAAPRGADRHLIDLGQIAELRGIERYGALGRRSAR